MAERTKETTEEETLDEQYGMNAIKSFASRKDGAWSWIMCTLLFLCNLFLFGCATTYGILFPNILKEFGKGRAITGTRGKSFMNLVRLLPVMFWKHAVFL